MKARLVALVLALACAAGAAGAHFRHAVAAPAAPAIVLADDGLLDDDLPGLPDGWYDQEKIPLD